jgi:galactokinase
MVVDDRLDQLIKDFQVHMGPYSPQQLWVASAPGRVNLIGEHTDYNAGFVLPIAIERNILMVGARRDDLQVRVYAQDYNEQVAFHLAANSYDEKRPWSNYIRGVLAMLDQAGYTLPGLDIALAGNIPKGGGLSSSAALEVASAMLAQVIGQFELPLVQMACLCQKAENEFVGVHCGIMDQFIVGLGQKNHALLIDCRSLEYKQVPWPLDDVQLLVVDTKVERGLAASAYNQRREECEVAVAILAKYLPGVQALRDISRKQLASHARHLPQPLCDRATHVVHENERTLQAAQALANGDWQQLGDLMNDSHESLRHLFEVSCPELDAVVEIARATSGVYGARMTGAGFGGCAIALVKHEAVPTLLKALSTQYPKVTGRQPGLLLTKPSQGARVWPLCGFAK